MRRRASRDYAKCLEASPDFHVVRAGRAGSARAIVVGGSAPAEGRARTSRSVHRLMSCSLLAVARQKRPKFMTGINCRYGSSATRRSKPHHGACPLCLRKRTCATCLAVSASCQKQTLGNDGLLRCRSRFFDQCCHLARVRKKDCVAARKFNDLRLRPLRHESLEVRVDHSVRVGITA